MKRLPANKAFLIFYGFDIALLLVIAVFLLPFSRSKNQPKTLKSAFIDSSLKNEVSEIRILDKKNKVRISLYKLSDMWVGTDSFSNDTLYWPAEDKSVANFIEEMTKENTWTQKASNVTSWKKLGVDSSSAVEVDLRNDSRTLGSVFFGYGDDLEGQVYFRTSEESTVWQAKTDAENFIYEKTPSFWADPYLIPLCARLDSDKNDSGLRRGELAYIKPAEHIKPFNAVSKDLNSGVKAVYNFYEKEDQIVVIPEFSGNEILSKLNYRYTISKWTYDKFIKELEEEEK